MLKGIDTRNYFKNYKRYIMNPWIHSIPTCSISLLYHSDHLVLCENKPITMRFSCIHFAIEGKKYCMCQLIILDVSTSCTLCFVYEHILLQVNTVILARNSAWWIQILPLCIPFFFFFFVKNTYICTGKNAKLKERKLEFSSWFCHPDSGQVSWAHFPHL